MDEERPLQAIRADLYRAKRRLRDLKNEEAEEVVRLVGCSLCKSTVGNACITYSGRNVLPHAERHRRATELVAKWLAR